jgi:hypothetical protein
MENKFKFRDPGENVTHEGKLDEIALEAAEMEEFKNLVTAAKGELEAIANVRQLLNEKFPQIKDLPERSKVMSSPVASNEFIIAKRVVELLRDK